MERPNFMMSNVACSFVRTILAIPVAVATMAFIPVNSPVDVDVHNQPREKNFQKENLVPIDCAELSLHQDKDAQLSYQRQHLLQQRTKALQDNDGFARQD